MTHNKPESLITCRIIINSNMVDILNQNKVF